VVIAITLTAVRRKRHMRFLTSAPNFRGSGDQGASWPRNLAFTSPILVILTAKRKELKWHGRSVRHHRRHSDLQLMPGAYAFSTFSQSQTELMCVPNRGDLNRFKSRLGEHSANLFKILITGKTGTSSFPTFGLRQLIISNVKC